MEPCARTIDPPRWAQHGVLLVSIALVWHSLGDHGLFPPDEGRYAAVSGWMATHGNWFEPQLRDQLHITKPPLAYWAQAVAQRAFGQTELAVRLPSALASTALLVATFLFARRCLGAMVATLAVGVLSSMPLFGIVGRLAITDPMLAAWWWGAICSAWMAIGEGPGRCRAAGDLVGSRGTRAPLGWIASFWACCALIGLTKGPLVLAPPVIVATWLAIAGRIRELGRLMPAIGLPLALLPLALVAIGFWRANPDRAESVWRFEFVDRFTGGKHDDPPGLMLLAFLAGLFPATAMMTLPGFNLPWRRAWSLVSAGDLRALLVASVVLPLLGFSILRGASATYLMPLAAPLSVLVAMMLSRWVGPDAGDVPAGERLPDVRITVGTVLTLVGLGLPAAAMVVVLRGSAPAWAGGWELVWISLIAVPAMLAGWVAIAWWRRPSLRLRALGVCFAGSVATWVGAHRAEDLAMSGMSSRVLADFVIQRGAPAFVFAVNNPTIDWIAGTWFPQTVSDRQLSEWMDANVGGSVVIAEPDLARIRRDRPRISRRLSSVAEFDAWPMKRIVVCEVVPAPKVKPG